MHNYIAWALICVLYSPALYNLYFGKTNWALEDFSHIYFILPISIFLVWRKRADLKESILQRGGTGAGSIVSLIILVIGIVLFTFGWRRHYDLIFIFSIIPVLFGMTGYLYGLQVARILVFPISYLIFLVPPPAAILDAITLPMRYGVSFTTERILDLLNFPITREGLLLSIGYKDIYMAPACSGFRSLITMFTLSLVYIYLIKGNVAKKLIIAAFIAPLALTGNLVRVITLCLITFYFGEEAGQGFFHNFSGIVIFMITITGLIGVEIAMDKLLFEKDIAGNKGE